MLVEKQKVLSEALDVLNKPDQPWEVTVEGDSIIARWKWMDATFFAPNEVNSTTKQFAFIVTLNDKGKWKELDKTEDKSKSIKMSGGKISMGSSSGKFVGKTFGKTAQIGIGKDNQTGKIGFVGFKFDTSKVKQPIRDFLTARGWKKAGLFG